MTTATDLRWPIDEQLSVLSLPDKPGSNLATTDRNFEPGIGSTG